MFLIREALSSSLTADITVVEDGERATAFFESADADESIVCPDLVILDINLPKKNGGQVLKSLRDSRRCAGVQVLVVTSSNSANDRDLMSRYGANAYFRKPSAYLEFMKLGEVVRLMLGTDDDTSLPSQ